jgi:hypothetical protein
MRGLPQRRKSHGGVTIETGLGRLVGSTGHVPNDEVVFIAVRHPKTKSEIGLL